MPAKPPVTVADVEGPWRDPNFESSLIARCRGGWNTPVSELTNEMLATCLRQKIALSLVLPEATRRIAGGLVDNTDTYDQELEDAIRSTTGLPPVGD